MKTNDVPLMANIDGEWVKSHFKVREFENKDGIVMVHPAVLEALERTRWDLGVAMEQEVMIIITDSVRTDADMERLAARLGWIDEGGLVSRDSKHHVKYGGIAVDFVAKYKESKKNIGSNEVGCIARYYFDFVKDDYADGHVHADMRGLI